ncbi:MAG: hypothetical protein EOP49_14645 [Sphingobacteriales bacterium]|nr:MAG: hypothetical protein EOP49_14645 [Sphingobacteriales bacterium]
MRIQMANGQKIKAFAVFPMGEMIKGIPLEQKVMPPPKNRNAFSISPLGEIPRGIAFFIFPLGETLNRMAFSVSPMGEMQNGIAFPVVPLGESKIRIPFYSFPMGYLVKAMEFILFSFRSSINLMELAPLTPDDTCTWRGFVRLPIAFAGASSN